MLEGVFGPYLGINENFEYLVISLQKYCLRGKKTKSKKYNSYIFDLRGGDMLPPEFKQKIQEKKIGILKPKPLKFVFSLNCDLNIDI